MNIQPGDRVKWGVLCGAVERRERTSYPWQEKDSCFVKFDAGFYDWVDSSQLKIIVEDVSLDTYFQHGEGSRILKVSATPYGVWIELQGKSPNDVVAFALLRNNSASCATFSVHSPMPQQLR